MNILIDEDVPYAHELFGLLGYVKTIPGRQIIADDLDKIDALIVRSVTEVNKTLLSGKSVCFVGTVTAGIDHIDSTWLNHVGIKFSAALGCNAIAVVEYVFSTLLILAERDNFMLEDKIVGIVGAGNIGKCLQKRLEILGVRVLICDPPRADRGEEGDFYTLNELVEQVDILTFHTPLLKKGPYKTLHLVDEELISKLKPRTILINTCRGALIDNEALLRCLKAGQKLSVVLDVWENEPNINTTLLNYIDIGTAHVAGHTLEGKIRGAVQIFEEYSIFIGKPQCIKVDKLLPIPDFNHIFLHGLLNQSILKCLIHLLYDTRRDDALLRKVVTVPGAFDKLRKNYFLRREWSSLHITCDDIKTAVLLQKLGFNATFCNKN